MNKHFHQSKQEIEKLLKKTKQIIYDPEFNPNTQFILMERKNDYEANIYNNKSTLLLLDFATKDIIEIIATLEYENYYQTIIDVVGLETLLYVFKKQIKGYLIYIKYSIRNDKIIFCISFHVSNEKER